MSPVFRPPQGGLFRVRGPQSPGQSRSAEDAEAREAIVHFMRVLERMDRAVQRSEAVPQRRKRAP